MKIQKAKMELVELDGQDVITASTGGGVRTFMLGGLYDGKRGNASFIDSDGKFSFYSDEGGNWEDLVLSFMNKSLDKDLPVNEDTTFWPLPHTFELSALDLLGTDGSNDDEFYNRFNGPYIWVEDHFQRIKQ